MTRKTLAPTLESLCGSVADDAENIRAWRELRALLTVARAAYRQADDHGVDRPCSCGVCAAVWKHIVEPRRRLARVSAPPAGGRR